MTTDLHEVVIFAGPHGAGKDTIENTFTASQPDATRHVRYSSRAQAPGELQGQAYHFVSQEEFDAMVQDGAFIDHAHYPEGSSGISQSALVRDVEAYRYTSITTNFEEGLSLARKIVDTIIAKKEQVTICGKIPAYANSLSVSVKVGFNAQHSQTQHTTQPNTEGQVKLDAKHWYRRLT